MDFDRPVPPVPTTRCGHLGEAATLVGRLRELDLHELGSLMGISQDLAALTAGRYQAWKPPFTPANARPALLAYSGEVFASLDARDLGEGGLAFAQDHLRILSGLYGLLRPLDLIQPYRLEMGLALANGRGRDLYAFWKGTLTRALARTLEAEGGPLVNLASGEFFRALDPEALPGRIITPVFEDLSRGTYRIVAIHAKRARGLLCRHVLRGRLRDPEDLKTFTGGGYAYVPGAGDRDRWVFRR